MMKKIVCAMLAMVALAAFAHQSRRTETLNWRCSYCHTAYRRTTVYVWDYIPWVGWGWAVSSQTKCPRCGR